MNDCPIHCRTFSISGSRPFNVSDGPSSLSLQAARNCCTWPGAPVENHCWVISSVPSLYMSVF